MAEGDTGIVMVLVWRKEKTRIACQNRARAPKRPDDDKAPHLCLFSTLFYFFSLSALWLASTALIATRVGRAGLAR